MVGRKDSSANVEVELRTVRRQLENLRENKFAPDPSVETIQNIILGTTINNKTLCKSTIRLEHFV